MKKIIFTMVMGIGMIFSVNGQALKVASNGNVGVGTASPTVALEVVRNDFSGLILKSVTGTAQIRMRGLVTGFIFDDQNGVLKSRFEYNNGSNQLNFFNDQLGGINFQTNSRNLHWNGNGRLGVGTNVPTENLHVIGTAGKTLGGSTWTVLSDRRLKENVSDYTGGLKEILAIRPVTFHYNGLYGTDKAEENVGVIAQEIQEIAPYMVKPAMLQSEVKYDENGNKRSGGESGEYLTYNANALMYMLVNAVKEQNGIIEQKDEQISELQEKLLDIEDKMNDITQFIKEVKEGGVGLIGQDVIKSQVEIKGSDLASLSQNRPNPFYGETVIDYDIPTNSKNAQLNFYNPNGQLVKTVQVDHIGVGQLTFRASDVPSGVYSYSLVVDGAKVDTKQMILTN